MFISETWTTSLGETLINCDLQLLELDALISTKHALETSYFIQNDGELFLQAPNLEGPCYLKKVSILFFDRIVKYIIVQFFIEIVKHAAVN